jgi:cholesterol oxidase
MQQVAIEMGRGRPHNKAPLGVYFGSRVGPRCSQLHLVRHCNNGCGHNARNKLTANLA